MYSDPANDILEQFAETLARPEESFWSEQRSAANFWGVPLFIQSAEQPCSMGGYIVGFQNTAQEALSSAFLPTEYNGQGLYFCDADY
jgi:hypothetical protein